MGDYFELKRKKELEGRGFVVEKAVHTRWHQDFFGCVDLIAFKKDVPIVFFEQITDKKHASEKLRELKEFKKLLPSCIQINLVVYEKNVKKWQITSI